MTWVSDRWPDDQDHVGMIVIRCRPWAANGGQDDSLISVEGWLYGLDFDGFADLTFKPAFLSG